MRASSRKKSDGGKRSAGKTVAVVAAGATLAAFAGLMASVVGKERPSRLHVEPEGEGWRLRTSADRNGARRFETKRDAVAAARELARQQSPSQLVIQRADGTEQARHHYVPGD